MAKKKPPPVTYPGNPNDKTKFDPEVHDPAGIPRPVAKKSDDKKK